MSYVESEAGLADEPVLPEQLWGRCRSAEPERRLLLAMLEQARCDLAVAGPVREDAVDWLMGRGAGRWAFRFNAVCGFLGLDADAIRGRLLRRHAA